MMIHGCLQQIHAGQSCGYFLRNQQHDHGSAAADHNGINENSKSLDQTRPGRIIPFSGGSSAGSGTGAGFIGEQTPLDTVHDHGSKTTGYCLAKAKCLREDPRKDCRKLADI